MSKATRILLGVVVIIVGIGMLFSNVLSFGNTINDNDSVSLEGIKKIIVNGSSEDIRIIKSHNSGLKAELTGDSSGYGFSKAKVNIKKSGNTITVEVKRSGFQLFSSSELKLDIYINDDYTNDLSLDLSSGSLNIAERFDVDTLDIDISSGSIILDELYTDKTRIDVSSGKLLIKSFIGDIDGEISSGDIDITYSEFNNDINFDVSSGSVEIVLPVGSDFDISGHKSSGNIDVEFDLNNASQSNSKIKGTVGRGGNKIDLDVSSGSISITKR